MKSRPHHPTAPRLEPASKRQGDERRIRRFVDISEIINGDDQEFHAARKLQELEPRDGVESIDDFRRCRRPGHRIGRQQRHHERVQLLGNVFAMRPRSEWRLAPSERQIAESPSWIRMA